MNVPIITWYSIVMLFISVLLFRLFIYLRHVHSASSQNVSRHHTLQHHFIELGSEREELFMPGDPTGHENYPPYSRARKPDYDDDIC